MIRLKRAYEKASEEDGIRILVERLWPRGVSKEKAKLDLWCKEIAPSTELRKWHHSHLDEWNEFVTRYLDELRGKQEAVKKLGRMAKKGTVTFIYATKDEKENNAVVLKDILEGKLKLK